jgi:5-methylthioadenosine/S-adenosylhomocysteine deaminase
MIDESRCLLIRNAHVLTLDASDQEWPRADIVIEAGKIAAIGPDAGTGWPRPFGRVIDAGGMLAMPGLINAHFHSPGNLMKGQLDGMPLELFMLHEVPPLADAREGDAGAHRLAHVRTQLGAVEMLRRGITAVHDDAYHVPVATRASVDAIMQAYDEVGIRATVAIDQPTVVEYEKYPFLAELLTPAQRAAMDAAPRQSGDELLELYQYLVERWHGAAQGRLAAAVSCSAPQRVTPDYLRGLSALSKRHDLPFNVHLLETKLQRVLGEDRYGCSLIRYMHDLGVLDERTMAIHAIWIDAADAALLAQSGCTVAHNPVCNLRLGSGVMPWHLLREAGVPLCLGTDEMCSDDSTNLWFVAKMAALIHTLSHADNRDGPTAALVLHAAAGGGARALRRGSDLGYLAPGCIADLCLLDLDTHAFTPLNDLVRQLVYCEDGSSVRYTVVGGFVVYDQGNIVTVDERALRDEARALAATAAADASNGADELDAPYREMVRLAAARDVGLLRNLIPFPPQSKESSQ